MSSKAQQLDKNVVGAIRALLGSAAAARGRCRRLLTIDLHQCSAVFGHGRELISMASILRLIARPAPAKRAE